jgi:hypothetical protein
MDIANIVKLPFNDSDHAGIPAGKFDIQVDFFIYKFSHRHLCVVVIHLSVIKRRFECIWH